MDAQTPTAPASFFMKSSQFERALWLLNAQAIADHSHFAPRALARRFMLTIRAVNDVPDDEIRNALADEVDDLLGRVAQSDSRDIGDVAAKLAVAILAEKPDDEGSLVEGRRAILAKALAELVILGDVPLPSADALNAMDESSLEMGDAPE